MIFLFLILTISLVTLLINVPNFIITFSTILLLPIIVFLFKSSDLSLIVISLLIPPLVAFFLFGKRELNLKIKDLIFEFSPLLVFTFIFTFTRYLALIWPNFIAMGERLRDYAILSAVNTSPFKTLEPWMVSSELNYYLYWYRFSAFFGKFLNLQIWDQYHNMSAFAIAFYCSSIFYLFHRSLKFSYLSSILSAILISFGSNLAGVLYYFKTNHNETWWGPSRVIQGTINEFPVWSFLLGDIHPHFLNLGLPVFLLIILFLFLSLNLKTVNLGFYLASFFPFSFLLTFNSNAWDLPLWGILALVCLVFYAIDNYKDLFKIQFVKDKFLILVPLLLLLTYSLYLSSRNISSGGHPFSMVTGDIKGSIPLQYLLHWGIPLFFILAYQIFSLKNGLLFPPIITALIGTLFLNEIKYFLISLLLLSFWNYFQSKKELRSNNQYFYIFLFSSLVLLILPEFIFLNDPYGGENERMNTVFKVFSFSWWIVWSSAILGCFKLVEYLPKKLYKNIALVALLPIFILHLYFFDRTIYERKERDLSMRDARGLEVVEKQFPGSKKTIFHLQNIPRDLIVMEASSGAYDYTSFVTTLAGKYSYLGWQNHVDLLTKQYGESNRRKDIINRIYSSISCEERKELLKNEVLDFIVVGNLEFQKYGSNAQNNWECFVEEFSSGGYKVYRR